MRRLVATGLAVLAGAVLAPSALAVPQGDPAAARSPQPLPAHSQRPVCGPPSAGHARCHAHVITHQDSATPLASTSYSSGWSPANLASAYNLPTLAGDPGTGPTVAIVDAYDNPNAETDLNVYRSQFGLGACTTANLCFKKVNQSGTASPLPVGDTGWGSEIDLDIEMVAAACPTCKVLLVEANSNGFGDLMAAVDRAYLMGAKYISNSYGAPEFTGETTYDGHFNHPGVAITVSSGDNGYGVEYPAASRYVTAVGGTSLSRATNTRGWSESAWSGAGSGCSALESKPAWQHDAGCSRRTVADVSAVANPNTGVAVYDSYGSSGGANWFVYGGTSVAAPFVAAVWALAPAFTNTTVTAAIPYATGNIGDWYDVISGSNGRCGTYLCQGVVGYDGPTGLGTPAGALGFGGTAGTGGGGGTTNAAPTAAFTPSCTGATCTFTNNSTDSDGTIASSAWNFGDGSTSTATSPSHTYTASGTYTVSLTVTDNGGATGSTSQSVSVTVPPPSGISLTATGSKTKGVNSARLSWTGASGSVDVFRNSSYVATANASPYTDTIGKGSGTYNYRVCPTGLTTGCSNTVTVVF